ncbi:MAG: hypothetical protein KAG53_03440 [Endozoicomonadaceae bacterium]|nr:hypothetical protein [Endozoicomonadaceae bacterium]
MAEAILAWFYGRMVKEIACRYYVLCKLDTTLGKLFATALPTRTTKLTTQAPSTNETNALNVNRHSLEQEYKSLSQEIVSLKVFNDKITSKISNLKHQVESKKEDLNKSREILKHNKLSIIQCTAELNKITQEINDISRNFSAPSVDKLREENPSIADLNDPYRPEKLTDLFKGLYDNQWTDLMEYFYDNQTERVKASGVEVNKEEFEKQNVILLANMIKEAHVVVKNVIEDMKNTIKNDLIDKLQKILEDRNSNKDIIPCDAILWKKDTIRIREYLYKNPTNFKDMTTAITHAVITEKHSEINSTALEEYLVFAIKLLILMEVQNYPLVLKWPVPGTQYDASYQIMYTTTKGSIVDYIAWPALYLHKDGPLICKAVIQAKTDETSKS